MAALTAVRLHKNVTSGGGAARGRQSTRAYCGSERIAVRPLDEPRRRRIGAAGRAALAERIEWSGTGGGGFGEYYWLVGRRAVESRIWGEFLGGGRSFARGRGEFGAWSVSPSAVPRVSEEASRSAFRLREACAGPNVCGVQCDRDRGAVSVPPFLLHFIGSHRCRKIFYKVKLYKL